MTDDEIRSLVRDAIAKRTATPGWSPHEASHSLGEHASRALFRLGAGGDADGQCVIEPSVRCVHCGYCQSFGH